MGVEGQLCVRLRLPQGPDDRAPDAARPGGKPIMQVTDNTGKYIFKELCKAGNEAHGGWVEYSWPKPGAGRLSRKVSFALAADISFAAGIQVSAGIYDEGITLPELEKVVEKMSDPAKYPAM
jgi:cytochrome c